MAKKCNTADARAYRFLKSQTWSKAHGHKLPGYDGPKWAHQFDTEDRRCKVKDQLLAHLQNPAKAFVPAYWNRKHYAEHCDSSAPFTLYGVGRPFNYGDYKKAEKKGERYTTIIGLDHDHHFLGCREGALEARERIAEAMPTYGYELSSNGLWDWFRLDLSYLANLYEPQRMARWKADRDWLLNEFYPSLNYLTADCDYEQTELKMVPAYIHKEQNDKRKWIASAIDLGQSLGRLPRQVERIDEIEAMPIYTMEQLRALPFILPKAEALAYKQELHDKLTAARKEARELPEPTADEMEFPATIKLPAFPIAKTVNRKAAKTATVGSTSGSPITVESMAIIPALELAIENDLLQGEAVACNGKGVVRALDIALIVRIVQVLEKAGVKAGMEKHCMPHARIKAAWKHVNEECGIDRKWDNKIKAAVMRYLEAVGFIEKLADYTKPCRINGEKVAAGKAGCFKLTAAAIAFIENVEMNAVNYPSLSHFDQEGKSNSVEGMQEEVHYVPSLSHFDQEGKSSKPQYPRPSQLTYKQFYTPVEAKRIIPELTAIEQRIIDFDFDRDVLRKAG